MNETKKEIVKKNTRLIKNQQSMNWEYPKNEPKTVKQFGRTMVQAMQVSRARPFLVSSALISLSFVLLVRRFD